MKTTTCIISAALLFVLSDSLKVSAQTYVSGGIYSNTTWTLANSPYIVTGDVIVFPGYTLTIEPGTTIKFGNSTSLEIRQATLVAAGTPANNIIFTSNSVNPVKGIWGGIWINGTSNGTLFNHCTFKYASAAVNCHFIGFIKNSIFSNNNTGINNVYYPVDSSLFNDNTTGISHLNNEVSNCTFKHNTTAIETATSSIVSYCVLDSNGTALNYIIGSRIAFSSISYNSSLGIQTYDTGSRIEGCLINYNGLYGVVLQARNDTVYDCDFFYNTTALVMTSHLIDSGSLVVNSRIKYNATGIIVSPFSMGDITECVIWNNGTGILIINSGVTISCNSICNNTAYNLAMNTSSHINVSDNDWCMTDSTLIAELILDRYDNADYGIVTFLPIDTLGCSPTGVSYLNEINEFSIYPNPASSSFTIRQKIPLQNVELKIFNAMGEIVFSEKTGSEAEHICRPNLTSGYYTIQIYKNDQASTRSLVIMK